MAPEIAIVKAKPTATVKAQTQFQAAHERRIEPHQQIKRLHQHQWSQAAIAQAVGVSVKTVQRYLKLPDFPARRLHRQSFGRSRLDPYTPVFLEWWNGGIRNPKLLMSLLQQRGYKGSERTVTRYISQLRQVQGLPAKVGHSSQSEVKVNDSQTPPFTARRASYLIVTQTENRNHQDQERLEYLADQHCDLAPTVEFADEFLQMLRQRQGGTFDDWLMKVLRSPLKPFRAFAEGLFEDYDAVKASMTLNVSNGAVDGCNWEDLPKDFPPYSTVYWHYKQWSSAGVIEQLMTTLHQQVREQVKKSISGRG